ncbi:UDP-N-acetylmuramoyl-L-alanine--D-glutamate ligase [Apilactobacillus timberlakei]|uniref:UDP-N-acetylmuramoylalanine--D-glutamate ligase n=1 Tax=Apilactobacillus timberlakei TaxID=2008380 RepID=A0ABY2YSV2_9LACO|nr:UDP-N-acetylmuramoyl-L-alanine--D-glutamate ligase [Apilactobacillus timberlakei]TPR13758.1 UDP-N-acetylmuramoyl-L-alanine--D-glutamate ligase [Apilactobacillus timberlakei]TPR15073.1 UDP-N-acetylmuramoyl-L-alanine--D-glutamate ligase [Apilactobacillus timberlakei]TPR16965.1 UDP-N-acetylmuramoyl-L-alanine--D-glutamate ligase [Apilactobacillus timberlakei]
MKKISKYENKNVLVLGAGKSGTNAAKLLVKLGAKVLLSDSKPLNQITDKNELEKIGVDVIGGKQSVQLFKDNQFDLVVKNPGIPYDTPIVEKAKELGLPIIVEVELASEINSAELIGVTGSNGKTTTTTMISKMLNMERDNGKSHVAGNIGIPASTVTEKASKDDDVVMELSSFMLLGITELHPHIAVLTNIFSNHLDYHKTRKNYVDAKMRITMNQNSDDFFVVNFDSEEWRKLSERSKAQVVPFSRKGISQAGSYEKDGKLYFKDEYIMDANEIKIPGEQNVENALAAIAVAKIKHRSNAAIKHVLTTFGGVRHRVQYVLTSDGRKVYNDSKATDIEATQMALRGFNEPVVLLAGGLDRGYKFDKLVPDLKKHVHSIVLFGETKNLLEDAAKKAGVKNIKLVDNLDEAVPVAYNFSHPGDIVLLSPANASWDQFSTFEVRGDQFIKDIEKITGKKEEQ